MGAWAHFGGAQTAQMIKTAAQPPRESLGYVEKAINEYARLPDDPKVHAFGLDMARSTMEVWDWKHSDTYLIVLCPWKCCDL